MPSWKINKLKDHVIIFVILQLLRPRQSEAAKYWCMLASTDVSVHRKSPKLFSQAVHSQKIREIWPQPLASLPPTHEEQDDKESAAALQVKAATRECFW